MRFTTVYDNRRDGGTRYAGPLFVADSLPAAEALTVCVQGPNGERLRIEGELVAQMDGADGDTIDHVRAPRVHRTQES